MAPLKGYVRETRRTKMVLDLDLNTPPSESREQEGTSVHAGPQEVQTSLEVGTLLPHPIDVEAIDDEVVISSPRSFAQARSNARRSHNGRTVVIDADSEDLTSRLFNNNSKRRRGQPNQTVINCDLYINLDGSSGSKLENDTKTPQLPKEASFSCPVCMGPLVDETSTKCGHIFCKGCIKAAISAQSKCPTCRRKVTMRDTFRIYLPASTLL